MMLHRNWLRIFLLAFALFGMVVAASPVVHATIFTVVNNDGAGEGFNDPTATAPVGGNTGTTIGAQRLNAFQYAANIWGGLLSSSVTIRVGATFDPLTCDATSAILGHAGAHSFIRDFSGAPIASTWYPVALANALHGSDLDPSADDIDAVFSSTIGTPGCLASSGWYYGLDANPPSGKIDFVSVLVHEMGHGLGFATLVNSAGAKALGFNDTFMRNLEDHGAAPSDYPSMTDGQRVAASTDTGNLHWVGANVKAASGVLTAGKVGDHVRMYAPNPQQPGSSVSHWDTALTPNQVMEPSYTVPLHDPVLELPLFQDIGWTLLAPPPPGTNTLTVTKSGTGSGTLTSTPAGINCGATCSASYAISTSVTLTAAATAGSAFTGWSGACPGTGTCTVTMNSAISVTATFALAPPSCTGTALPNSLSEGFDNITSLPAAGWVQTNHSTTIGTTGWFQGNAGAFPAQAGATTSYIGANFNNTTGSGTVNNWLVTPPLTLQNGATMTFFTRTEDVPAFPDRLQVRMSTNGASSNVGTLPADVGDFTTLLLDINPTYTLVGFPSLWTQFNVTVSGLASPTTGRLAFRYFVENGGPNGANSSLIGIDTVQFCPAQTTPPSTNADLSNLTISAGSLSPAFATSTLAYTDSVPNATSSVTVTPTVADSTATVKVNGTTVTSGSASGPIALAVGSANVINVVVTAQDGTTTKTYTITVTRAVAPPSACTASGGGTYIQSAPALPLAVSCSGGGAPTSYAWHVTGVPGTTLGTNSSYTPSTVNLGMTSYYVTVSNGLGSSDSSATTVTVNAAAGFTPITSLPYVITTQGTYALTGDLATGVTSGNSIEVQTNNVIIDLNGHKLGGQGAGTGTQAIGIHALNRRNITIRNGTIRGFYYGVKLEDSSGNYTGSAGHVIENLRADFNTFTGIEVNGTGNIVRGNQVVNTGGSTVSTNSYAITARGPGARVLDNDVIGTVAANAAYGVEIVSAASSVVEKNRIANTTSLGGGNVYGIHAFNLDDASAISANTISNASVAVNSYGIYVDTDADVTVSDNRISRLGNGIFFTGASGSYMNNLVRGATTPYTGGTAAGATNY